MKKVALYINNTLDDIIRDFILKLNGNNNLEEAVILVKTKYYRYIQMQPYLNSKNRLVQLLIEEGLPTVEKWNKIAQKEDLYSSVSIKYIEECSWKELERKLKGEIKDFLKEKL